MKMVQQLHKKMNSMSNTKLMKLYAKSLKRNLKLLNLVIFHGLLSDPLLDSSALVEPSSAIADVIREKIPHDLTLRKHSYLRT